MTNRLVNNTFVVKSIGARRGTNLKCIKIIGAHVGLKQAFNQLYKFCLSYGIVIILVCFYTDRMVRTSLQSCTSTSSLARSSSTRGRGWRRCAW